MTVRQSALSASLVELTPQADTAFALNQPSDLQFSGDLLYVVDAGNDRLVVFDMALRPQRVNSRKGAGPGELQVPQHIVAWHGQLVVSEGVNRRLSVFDEKGAFVRTIATPDGYAAFDIGSLGTIYTAAGDRATYLVAHDTLGSARRFATRPLDLYDKSDVEDQLPLGTGSELVVVDANGTIHVLDNQIGVLFRFDSTGSHTAARRLPDELDAELRAEQRLTIRDFESRGMHVLAAPLVKDFSLTDDGHLFLLFRAERLFGLLIDPESYQATPLHLPPSAATATPLRAARAAVIRSGTIYALTGESVSAHTLRVIE